MFMEISKLSLRKMIKNLFLTLTLLFAIGANAHQLDSLDGAIPSWSEVDEQIKKINLNNKQSQEEKDYEVLGILLGASSYMPYEDSLRLMVKNENTLFSKPSSIERGIDYINFSLFSFMPILTHNKVVGDKNWSWPFQHSYDEFLQHLIDLTNLEQCDNSNHCFKVSDDPLLKVMLSNMALSLKYEYNSNWLDYEKVNTESIRILEANKQWKPSILNQIFVIKDEARVKAMWPGFRLVLLYQQHLNRFKLLVNTSSFDKVLKEGEYLDQHFAEVLDFLEHDGSNIPDAIKGSLISSFEADKYLGKYDEIIKKGNLILEKMPKNSKFNLTRDFRHAVLKELSEAYWQTHQNELRIKCILEALEIELETGSLNGNHVADLIIDAIYQRDLITARKYNVILNKECAKNKDTSRCKNIDDLLNKITGVDPDAPTIGLIGIGLDLKDGNIIIPSLVPNKAAEKAGIKVGDQLLEIDGVDVKNYSFPEVAEHIRGIPNEKVSLLIHRNKIDNPIKYEIVREKQIDDGKIIQNYWLKNAFDHERNINPNYDIKDGDFSDDQVALKLYEDAFGKFLAGGNEYIAAIYAKKYINVLQKLRSQLASSKSVSLNQFTSNQADKIKSIANIFYNVGQYDAAWACQRIIHENEFLDYVRRRGVDKDFLSTIPANAVENDYLIKLNANFKENGVLRQKLVDLKGKEGTSEYKLISSAIDKNTNELALLRKNYTQSLKDESTKNLNASNQPIQQLNLKSNEAAIQFMLNNNQLTIFISTLSQNERFSHPVNANQLRENIQKLNISVATQKPISQELVAYISDLFMKDPLKLISGKGIRSLRVSMDNTLNALPLALLKVDGKNLGEFYSVEKIGIGKVVASEQKNKKFVAAYAATKGNSEFSSLPGASKEIEKIMSIKSAQEYSNKQSFVDEKFNLKTFKSGLSNNNYFVHIATHFRIDGNTAKATRMLLGDGSTLSLEDLRDDLTNISADLITLSACNTGQQFISSKTQTYDGLSSTFQVKGVKNVISTLWEISDDATADFMTIFYSLLLNNKISPSEALALTQKVFINGSIEGLSKNIFLIKDPQTASAIKHLSKYTNPYFWAAFQISTIN